jgi:hypothetical protein
MPTREPAMPNNPIGSEAEGTTKRITLCTKVASICAMAYCVISFYRGFVIPDPAQVFVSVGVLVFVLVSCHLLEILFNEKVNRPQ